EVHAIELIAGENQDVRAVVFHDVANLLANRVGGALVPVGSLVGLLRRQHLDEAAAEGIELVGVGDVPMQADAEELRQDINALHTAVDAVADGDVDQPVLAGDRNGGLAAQLRQRVQACASSSSEDETENFLHGCLAGLGPQGAAGLGAARADAGPSAMLS